MNELLQFAGQSLAYGFNLYVEQQVEVDKLCLVAVSQQNKVRYLTFESDHLSKSHQAARESLRAIERETGYDIATLTYDIYYRNDDMPEKQDALVTQIFTLDSVADRRVVYLFTRVSGAVIPVRPPFLIGDWDKQTFKFGNAHVIDGMRRYFEENGIAH